MFRVRFRLLLILWGLRDESNEGFWVLSECKRPKFRVFWLQKMVGSGVCFVSGLGDWPGLFGFLFFVKIVRGALCLSLGFIWIRGAVWEGSLRRLVLGMDEGEEKGDECQ